MIGHGDHFLYSATFISLRIRTAHISRGCSLPVLCQRNNPFSVSCGSGVVSFLWIPSFTRETRGHLSLGPFQSRCSSLAAAGDTTVVPSDCSGDLPINPEQFDSVTVYEKGPEDDEEIDDGEADLEFLDGHKMVRVCDKLIEVFMVDKPTTTDWRRLLAFSKEWCNIRPHFYKCFRERADAESDPGMKHKLLQSVEN